MPSVIPETPVMKGGKESPTIIRYDTQEPKQVMNKKKSAMGASHLTV